MREQRVIEISIKDLVFYFLHHLAEFVSAALIGMALISGSYYVLNKTSVHGSEIEQSEYVNVNKVNPQTYEMQNKLNTQIYNLQVNELEIEKQQLTLEQVENYLQNSILMQIDPYNKLSIEKGYIILQPDVSQNGIFKDPIDSVTIAYGQGLVESLDYSEISNRYHLDTKYIMELIKCETNIENNTVVLAVTGTTEQMAADILESVEQGLLSRQKEITLRYGQHDIIRNYESKTYSIDDSLLDLQRTNRNLLIEAKNGLKRAENAVYDAKVQISTLETNIESLENSTTRSSIRRTIKTAMLGFLLGGLVMAVFCFFKYMVPAKIHTVDEIRSAWGLPILGVIDKQSKAKVLKRFDNWLLNLEGSISGQSDSSIIETVAVTLNSILEPSSKVLITGKDIRDCQQKHIELLENSIRNDISIVYTSNLHDASGQGLLSKCDTVILIVERDSTDYKYLQEIIDILSVFHKTVKGCIVY